MATTDAAANKQLFDLISQYLGSMDLGGLFSIGADGLPGGWLWDQITSGIDNEAAIQMALEATPQFQARYGIISELRKQAGTGAAVHVPTVAEVREYEQSVTQIMKMAGLPSFMYDNVSDAHQLMIQGLSVAEVEQRLGQAWERVQNTDPAVRAAFGEFYGITGDAAMAAAFLDPTRTLASLERDSRAAYTSGMGHRVGVNIDKTTSERIADLPKTEAGIYENLTQLGALEGGGVFTETMGEAATDLSVENTGIDAVFFGDGAASGRVERRVIERNSARAAVPGGGLRTQRGLTGVSSD